MCVFSHVESSLLSLTSVNTVEDGHTLDPEQKITWHTVWEESQTTCFIRLQHHSVRKWTDVNTFWINCMSVCRCVCLGGYCLSLFWCKKPADAVVLSGSVFALSSNWKSLRWSWESKWWLRNRGSSARHCYWERGVCVSLTKLHTTLVNIHN